MPEANILDELNITLKELNEAIENVRETYHVYQELKNSNILQAFSNPSGNQFQSIIQLLQNVDLEQIKTAINDPQIVNMITDPELLNLFSPDTGTTPGTSPNQTDAQNKS